MTTSVKVSAHCASDKQVRIIKSQIDGSSEATTTLIQDGETNEQVVYDGWAITVNEELKPI